MKMRAMRRMKRVLARPAKSKIHQIAPGIASKCDERTFMSSKDSTRLRLRQSSETSATGECSEEMWLEEKMMIQTLTQKWCKPVTSVSSGMS